MAVYINSRTAVHAGSRGVLTTKDPCKTPPHCNTVTYTNLAYSRDTARGASSVRIEGNPQCNLRSIFARSTGDEDGTCGGVRSGTIKGKAEFLTASPDVFIEGIPAVRHHDLMVSNNRNTAPVPLMQPDGFQPPPHDPRIESMDHTEEATHVLAVTTLGEGVGAFGNGRYGLD